MALSSIHDWRNMVHRRDWVCTPELAELLNLSIFFSPEKSPWKSVAGWQSAGSGFKMLRAYSMQEDGWESWADCVANSPIERSNASCSLCGCDYWEDQAVWLIDNTESYFHACFRCTIEILSLEKVATTRVDFREYLANTTAEDRFGQTYFATEIWNDLIAEIVCTDKPLDSKPDCGRCSEPMNYEDLSEHWAWRMYTAERFESVHAECVSEFEFYVRDSDLLASALRLVDAGVSQQTSIESKLGQVRDLLDKKLTSEEEAASKRLEILKDL